MPSHRFASLQDHEPKVGSSSFDGTLIWNLTLPRGITHFQHMVIICELGKGGSYGLLFRLVLLEIAKHRQTNGDEFTSGT